MGTLTYDSTLVVSFDDAVLAHLQNVIWTKLKRGEQFAFTWLDEGADPARRRSIWVSPNIPLSFEYDDGAPTRLDPKWVEALTKSANSASGLQVVPAPEAA